MGDGAPEQLHKNCSGALSVSKDNIMTDVYDVPTVTVDSDESDALNKWDGIDGPPLEETK